MHTADDQEYWEELLKKMDEEIGEFKENPTIEELVDIIEVAYSMAEFRGVSIKELEGMRQDKANKRGRFKKRIIFDPIREDQLQE